MLKHLDDTLSVGQLSASRLLDKQPPALTTYGKWTRRIFNRFRTILNPDKNLFRLL